MILKIIGCVLLFLFLSFWLALVVSLGVLAALKSFAKDRS